MKLGGKLFIILYIAFENIQCIFTNSSLAEDNLFQETNEKLQTIVAQLLTLLKVDPKFLKENKIKLLLTIHSHSQQISEYNLKVYQDIKKASKVVYDNTTVNFISDFPEDYEETIKFVVEQEFKHANEFIKNATVSKKNHSSYLFNFLTDFIDIVDKLTLDDIVRPINNTGHKKKKTIKLLRTNRRDLKVWRPSYSPEVESKYNQSRRIFQGQMASFKKFPYIASIHVMGKYACGSSIISKQFVITAASCLQLVYNIQYRGNPNILAVRVGSDYTQRLGELVPIINVYFHPFYQPDCLRNNLAIARFKMKPSLRRRLNIMRIQYEPMKGPLPENITQVVMVGWGDQHPQVSVVQDQLFSTNIDVYNQKLCVDTYSRQFVNENNFCAGFTNRGGGACRRDVGGPAVISGILLGVVSFGPPVCGTPNAPTVFTNISNYVHWINSIVSERSRLSPERTKLVTTTKFRADETPKPHNALRSKENQTQQPSIKELPEALRFIKDILRLINIVEPHSLASDVDDVLYGELEDEKKSFWTTTIAPDKLHHPLVNKSISLEPEVSIPPDLPTTTPMSIVDELHLGDILKTFDDADLISTRLSSDITIVPNVPFIPMVRLKKDSPKKTVKEVKPSSYTDDSSSSSQMSPNLTGEYSDSGYDPFQNEIFDVLNRSLQSINITITKNNKTLKFISNTLKTKPKKRTRLQWTYDKPTKPTSFKKTTLACDYDEESTTKRKTKKATTLDSYDDNYGEPSTTKRNTKVTLFKIVAIVNENSKRTAKPTSYAKATKKTKKHKKQGTLKTETTRPNSKYSFTTPMEVSLKGTTTNSRQQKTTNEFDYEDLRPKDKSYGRNTGRRPSKPEIRFSTMTKTSAKKLATLKYEEYETDDETSSEEPSRRSLLDYIILD